MSVPDRVERWLVRIPNWLGDALMARPLFLALRAAHPRAEVLGAGPGALLDLLRGDATWQREAAIERRGSGAAAGRAGAPPAGPFDVAVICPPSFSSALGAWRAGARRRVGFAGDARDLLLTDRVPRPDRGERHLSVDYLALGERLGAAAVPWRPLNVDPLSAARARALGADGTPYAVLGPGAAYGPAKRWPLERFAAVGRSLADRGLGLLLAGVTEDRPLCERLRELAGGIGRVVAGETRLGEQAALCAGARVTVCNDSGLAHLAAATGSPAVTIFGSTSSAWSAPLGPRVRVVQRPPVCAPCFQRTCRIGYRCLEAVSARDVLRACDALLAGEVAA
jgi:heptosyltransferase-2